MSESEHKAIISAIELVQNANIQSHKDVIEIIEKGLQGVNARIDANCFVSSRDIQGLTTRLDRMNGNVAALQKENNDKTRVVEDYYETKKELRDIIIELKNKNEVQAEDIKVLKTTKEDLHKRIKNIKKYWWLWILLGVLTVLIIINIYHLGLDKNFFKWMIDLLVMS
jgi:chromosome segregation ATPase